MKHSELKQLIREELNKALNESKDYPKILKTGTKVEVDGEKGKITGNFMNRGDEYASYKITLDSGETIEISTADKSIKKLEENTPTINQREVDLKITDEINEGKLSPERQERLDSLIDELRFATDPDNEYYDYDGRDEDEIMSDIRLEFGNKIADQISDNNFHYPRHGWTPTNDPLEDKEESFQSPRITKGGKMYPQDINRRKNYYKK